jgi:AcrR family transcriptional regulator
MASDESKRNRIMEFSFKRFTSLGVTHVTMDEISRGVGIGKGTLYKFFPSKEALLLQTVDFVAEGIEKKIVATVSDDSLNTMEKLGAVMKILGE